MVSLVGNQRGLVLVMVLSAMMFMVLVAQETVFSTQVDRRAVAHGLHDLRAYYAARSGLEVGLLRVRVYRKMIKQISPGGGGNLRAYMDLMWKLPFGWPPVALQGAGPPDPEKVKAATKNSLMKREGYRVSITPTSGLLDLNDLASPVTKLRERQVSVFVNLMEILSQGDEVLDRHIRDGGMDATSLALNIRDGVDPDEMMTGAGGASGTLLERSLYPLWDFLPFQRSFTSLQELYQVEGMTDPVYRALRPFLTLYGSKGVDVNNASAQMIQAVLGRGFPQLLAQRMEENNRALIPEALFEDLGSFLRFLDREGLRGLSEDLEERARAGWRAQYLSFDAPYNFHIESEGFSGSVSRTLAAVYVDVPAFQERGELWMSEARRGRPRINVRGGGGNRQQGAGETSLEGRQDMRPAIIYWKEGSLKDTL